MKRLDDYTEVELSAATNKDIDRLIEVEAMVAGVAKPVPPEEADPEPLPPISPTRRVYTLATSKKYGSPDYWPQVFNSEYDAKAIADLANKSAIGTYDHSHYGTSTYDIGSVPTVYVVAANIPDSATVKAHEHRNKALTERSNIAKAAREEYAAACEKYEEVASRVRSRWYQAGSARQSARNMLDERARFRELANGDADVADKFLAAKWGEEVVRDLMKWELQLATV
jgi:hypothetical protein